MRVWTLIVAGLAIAAFAVPVACGPSDREVCNETQTVYCQRLAECAPFLLSLEWGDVKTCADRRIDGCRRDLGADDTDTSQGTVEDCARDLRAASCEDLFSVRALPASCAPRGDRDDGEPCLTSAQCRGGRCDVAAAGECGTCVSLGVAGARCATAESCAAGYGCVADICTPLGRTGAACDGARPCGSGLACVGGACGAPLALGAECSLASPCCDALRGHVCSNGRCVARTLVAPGAECSALPDGTLGACGGGGRCELGPARTTICEAPAADGAACDDVRGLRCLTPARCIGGRCRLPSNELVCD